MDLRPPGSMQSTAPPRQRTASPWMSQPRPSKRGTPARRLPDHRQCDSTGPGSRYRNVGNPTVPRLAARVSLAHREPAVSLSCVAPDEQEQSGSTSALLRSRCSTAQGCQDPGELGRHRTGIETSPLLKEAVVRRHRSSSSKGAIEVSRPPASNGASAAAPSVAERDDRRDAGIGYRGCR